MKTWCSSFIHLKRCCGVWADLLSLLNHMVGTLELHINVVYTDLFYPFLCHPVVSCCNSQGLAAKSLALPVVLHLYCCI